MKGSLLPFIQKKILIDLIESGSTLNENKLFKFRFTRHRFPLFVSKSKIKEKQTSSMTEKDPKSFLIMF